MAERLLSCWIVQTLLLLKGARASPLHFVESLPDQARLPPVLIMHGARDPLIAARLSQRLHDAIAASPASSEVRLQILFASLALMTPAIARLFQPLGAETLTMPPWLAALAAIAIFDIKQLGKVTRATWFGLAVSIAFAAALLATMILFVPEPNSL